MKPFKAINRIQPFENVEAAILNAREARYTSVGHDITFWLPFQTEDYVIHTVL